MCLLEVSIGRERMVWRTPLYVTNVILITPHLYHYLIHNTECKDIQKDHSTTANMQSDRDAPAPTTTARAFDSSAAATFARSASLSRIPRFALGTEPVSPQPTLARTEAPSSCTSESTSSRVLGLRALDNGTPSRLAQFRTKNWLRGGVAGKKRALELSDSAAQPPKRRAVTTLFSDEPTHVPVSAIATGSSTSSTSTNTSASVSEPTDRSGSAQEPLADATASSQPTDSADDTRLRLQHEIKVATCLAQDLRRDNARLELKTDALRDDIDFYYELLAKVEAVAHAARRQSTDASPSSELADALKRIISAPRTPHAGAKASVERETQEA